MCARGYKGKRKVPLSVMDIYFGLSSGARWDGAGRKTFIRAYARHWKILNYLYVKLHAIVY